MNEKDLINRKRVCEDPSNPYSGFKFVLWELWKHLPVWTGVLTTIMTAMMTMLYFNPSRPIYIVTAVFPLICVSLYFYARYSSDRSRPWGAKGLKPMFAIVGSMIVILLIFASFLKPVWSSEVVMQINDFYPTAQVGQTDEIFDDQGLPVIDTEGKPLIKNEMMRAPDGIEYKVEGKQLINLEFKESLVTGYEIWCVSWTFMFLLHCWYFRGWRGVITFFGAALLYGFLLESGGVSKDFFREYNYHMYLPFLAAPVATMTGWPMVFYASVHTYEMFERRWQSLKKVNFLIIGLLISLTALFRDLNLDPVATNLSLWTWHELLPAWFLGVPLVNFTSWLTAVFSFGAGYIFIHRRVTWSGRTKIIAMFVMIPVFLFISGTINFAICGLIEGFDGPAWTVRSLP